MLNIQFVCLIWNLSIGSVLLYRRRGVIEIIDVYVRQYLATGDYVNLLRNCLQVIQDQSDAVGGIDDGALWGSQLSSCTVNLEKQNVWSHLLQQ